MGCAAPTTNRCGSDRRRKSDKSVARALTDATRPHIVGVERPLEPSGSGGFSHSGTFPAGSTLPGSPPRTDLQRVVVWVSSAGDDRTDALKPRRSVGR